MMPLSFRVATRVWLIAVVAPLLLAGRVAAAELRLPFEGVWFVGQGGDTLNVNHHMSPAAPPQWFGVDFVKAGGPGNRALAKGAGKALEDYYAWDAPVLAPIGGEIVAAVSDRPDNAIGATDLVNVLGNHVTIKADERTYVFLAHFRKGSLAVKVGERVKAGAVLGRCGNSGNSTAPHLQLHVQDTADFYRGTGRNVVFTHIDATLSGKLFRDVSWPMIRGLFVAPTAVFDRQIGFEGRVVSVEEGDTLTVEVLEKGKKKDAVRVRLLGIDAPELGQPYGQKAREHLSLLALGKVVTVHGRGRDEQGVLLGNIYFFTGSDDMTAADLGWQMLEAGLAWSSPARTMADPGITRRGEGEEPEYRRARRGLWAEPDPVPPWEFRLRQEIAGAKK